MKLSVTMIKFCYLLYARVYPMFPNCSLFFAGEVLLQSAQEILSITLYVKINKSVTGLFLLFIQFKGQALLQEIWATVIWTEQNVQ